jgi:hypothetical protein
MSHGLPLAATTTQRTPQVFDPSHAARFVRSDAVLCATRQTLSASQSAINPPPAPP